MFFAFAVNENQARKKSTKINILGPETARWGGGLPREGVVAEKFVPSLESLSSLGFEERNLGCSGTGGVQKVCAKEVCAHVSFPNCPKRVFVCVCVQSPFECRLDRNGPSSFPSECHVSLLLGLLTCKYLSNRPVRCATKSFIIALSFLMGRCLL